MREALADQVRGSDSLTANCCNKFANASKNFAIKNPPAEAGGLSGLCAGWPQSPDQYAAGNWEAHHDPFFLHAFQYKVDIFFSLAEPQSQRVG